MTWRSFICWKYHLLIRERHSPVLQSLVNRQTQIAITPLANGLHSRLLEILTIIWAWSILAFGPVARMVQNKCTISGVETGLIEISWWQNMLLSRDSFKRIGSSLETISKGPLKDHIIHLDFPALLLYSQSLQQSVSNLPFISPSTSRIIQHLVASGTARVPHHHSSNWFWTPWSPIADFSLTRHTVFYGLQQS